jgi:transposase-like protein
VSWYLRYLLSYEHVTELAAERRVEGGCHLHLALGAGLSTRAEQTLPTASQSDEQELSDRRDLFEAKPFLRGAIELIGQSDARVMNVDKNPAYPAAVRALKADGTIPCRVALRQCKYLNDVIEQDHQVG